MLQHEDYAVQNISLDHADDRTLRISADLGQAAPVSPTWLLPVDAARALAAWWAGIDTAAPRLAPRCDRRDPFEFIMHSEHAITVALLDELGNTVSTGWHLPRRVVEILAARAAYL